MASVDGPGGGAVRMSCHVVDSVLAGVDASPSAACGWLVGRRASTAAGVSAGATAAGAAGADIGVVSSLAALAPETSLPDWHAEKEALESTLPLGVFACGFYCAAPRASASASAGTPEAALSVVTRLGRGLSSVCRDATTQLDGRRSFLVWVVSPGSGTGEAGDGHADDDADSAAAAAAGQALFWCTDSPSSSPQRAAIQVVDPTLLLSGLVALRCRLETTVPLPVTMMTNSTACASEAVEAAGRLRRKLRSQACGFVFPGGTLVVNGPDGAVAAAAAATDARSLPRMADLAAGVSTLRDVLAAADSPPTFASADSVAGASGGGGGGGSKRKGGGKGGKGKKGKGGKGGGGGGGSGGASGGNTAAPVDAFGPGDVDGCGVSAPLFPGSEATMSLRFVECMSEAPVDEEAHAPVVVVEGAAVPCVEYPLACDVLALAGPDMSQREAADLVKQALSRQAALLAGRLVAAVAARYTTGADESGLGVLAAAPVCAEALHFLPSEGPTGAPHAVLAHPVTALYALRPADDAAATGAGTEAGAGSSATVTAGSGSSAGATPAALFDETTADATNQRRALHTRLGLSLERPLLRRSAALWFGAAGGGRATRPEHLDSRGTPLLASVHVGIAEPSVPDGVSHTVKGDYLYYHYMQQGFDDKGWGCAYRSLQTLASWFRLNHYTRTPVPSHEEIQAALVRIKDKPSKFRGSRQWIGSLEVGYVLDELLGVESKYISVSRGSELPSTARQLARHFDDVGTPVMMGGGQLAYTCLGVCYNEHTGEAQFLILDPHYTGADDLDLVQTKTVSLEGYRAVPVSWRGSEAFSDKDFYNLCLPMRPTLL